MFDSKGFDAWADNYDRDMELEAKKNSYPFAGYREIHESITQTILQKRGATVLELGFGTGTLAGRSLSMNGMMRNITLQRMNSRWNFLQ